MPNNRLQYRMPGETVVNDWTGCESFIVETFDGSYAPSFPARSTTKAEHRDGVLGMLSAIETGELDKCVLARTIVSEGTVDMDATFRNLCEAYPAAFVFRFSSPETGDWMGASPELLLAKKGNKLHSMALAGTRAANSAAKSAAEAGESEPEWDDKNLREHRLVVDFIATTMREAGYEPEAGDTKTITAGPVEHLMTPITTEVTDSALIAPLELAKRLSPTPALAGLPRDAAVRTIGEYESFRRGCYGGYCGPVFENGDFALFVNLRSMQRGFDRYALYAGGGIVAGSDPDLEWEETERKASTLSDKIILKKESQNPTLNLKL